MYNSTSQQSSNQHLYEYILTFTDEGLIFKEYTIPYTRQIDDKTYIKEYSLPYMRDIELKINEYSAHLPDELNEDTYAEVLLPHLITEQEEPYVIERLKSAMTSLLKEEKVKSVAYYDSQISKITNSTVIQPTPFESSSNTNNSIEKEQ